MTVTVYPARKIVTMNPARPHATHVAVRRRPYSRRRHARRTGRLGRIPAGRALRRQGADAGPGRRPQPCHGRLALGLCLLRLLRPHGPRRRGLARPQVHRRRGRAAARGCRPAGRPGGAARRLVAGRDLLWRPAGEPARPRQGLDRARGRRAQRLRPYPECEHEGAGTGRNAPDGHRPSRHPAGRGRPADRRDEGPGRDGPARRPYRLRPRPAGLRRAGPAPFRQAVRAHRRDHGRRPRQPAAGRRPWR